MLSLVLFSSSFLLPTIPPISQAAIKALQNSALLGAPVAAGDWPCMCGGLAMVVNPGAPVGGGDVFALVVVGIFLELVEVVHLYLANTVDLSMDALFAVKAEHGIGAK